jgi:DNA-binding response OmpR family regulator
MPGRPAFFAGNSPVEGEKAAPVARRVPTVLVLDDEGLIRWTMHEGLTQNGFRVLEAATGAEAIEIAKSRPVDLLLLDLQLPDMDGIAVLSRMREEGISCRAILMTAYGSPEVAEKALFLGARSCVAKPFDLDEMLLLIKSELAGS